MQRPHFPGFSRISAVLCVFSLITFAHAGAGPGSSSDFHGRRVLVLGIDGFRRDVLSEMTQNGSAPQLAKLAAGSLAYWNIEAGGPPLGVLNQPTISGPGWTTVCTGVFANKHGVLGNGDKFKQGHFTQYPHFFKRIRDAYPQAWLGSIACNSWPEINTILIQGSGEKVADHVTNPPVITTVGEDGRKEYDDDTNVTADALQCLKEKDPDVLFVHFLEVDHQGHRYGFSRDVPEYVNAVKKVDGHIGELLTALEQRPKFKDENWLVVVTADHGGIGRKHGGQTREEREIFTFFKGEGFPAEEVTEGRSYQTLVAPTILQFLGVKVDPAWGYESEGVSVSGK